MHICMIFYFHNAKDLHQVDFERSKLNIHVPRVDLLKCSCKYYVVIGFLNARGLFKVDMLKAQSLKTSIA